MRLLISILGISLPLIPYAFAGSLEEGDKALREERYPDAYRILLPEAQKGSAFAQYNVGYLREKGLGVEKNLDDAINWYTLAAKQGDADAQVNMGQLYEHGLGVSPDPKRAVEFYKLSAAQGNAIAENNLGSAYLRGSGVAQDYMRALKLFISAAEKGVPPAQNSLAIMYLEGRGIPKNPVEGTKWLKMAAAQGFRVAQVNVFTLTRDMALNGNTQAMHNTAGYYLSGYGVDANLEEALSWYTKASDAGFKDSARVMSQLYERGGYGVQPDAIKSAYWKKRYEN